MKRIVLICLLCATPALAEEPTVAFTQSELQLYVQAIQAAAVAQFTAAQAKPAQDKILKAFTTTKEPHNAQQIPASGPHDGGSGTQPEIRQEGGGAH